jgi:hypothetical protein
MNSDTGNTVSMGGDFHSFKILFSPLNSYPLPTSAHPTKILAISQIHLFLTLSAFTLFTNNPALFSSFGFSSSISNDTQPIVIGFLLFQLVSAPIDPIITVLMNALTRKYEYEAGT